MIVGALQAYLSGVGVAAHPAARILLGSGGLLIALPDLGLVLPDFASNGTLFTAGVVCASAGFTVTRLAIRRQANAG